MRKKTTYKAPEYASTTTDTGFWGSSTNDKNGTTYNAPSWISDSMGTVANNYNTTLNNMLSNDFANDPNFQAYQNQLNKTMAQNYDTSVLSQLANRGLMRSSGLQSATNAFNDTLADKTVDLYDNYYNRQQNNLSNLMNTSNALYNYMAGTTNQARTDTGNVNAFNMANAKMKYQADQANAQANNALWGQLANTAGKLALATATGGASLAVDPSLISGGGKIDDPLGMATMMA